MSRRGGGGGFGLGEDDGRMASEGAKGKEGIEREREVVAARRALPTQQTERHGAEREKRRWLDREEKNIAFLGILHINK
jgi:hypothetical protein